MAFPKHLLTEGEELIVDARPHWIALAGPVFVTLLILAAEIALFVGVKYVRHHSVAKWVALGAGLVLFVIYPLRKFIQWVTSHFVVTNERIIHRQGLIAKTSMEVPLNRINDVRFHQSIFERMVGAGDLIIESAGTQGQEVFSDIRRPEAMQRTIYERAEAREGRAAPQSPASASTAQELSRLADLRDRGVLTEAEFRAQKAKLLGEPSE